MKKAISYVLAIFGILIALAPHTFLPVDPVMKNMVMVCHYTALALSVTGILILVFAVFSLVNQKAAAQWDLAAGVSAVGSFLIILLIGFCKHPDARCRVGTEPGEIIFNAVVLILGIYGYFRYRKDETK